MKFVQKLEEGLKPRAETALAPTEAYLIVLAETSGFFDFTINPSECSKAYLEQFKVVHP